MAAPLGRSPRRLVETLSAGIGLLLRALKAATFCRLRQLGEQNRREPLREVSM